MHVAFILSAHDNESFQGEKSSERLWNLQNRDQEYIEKNEENGKMSALC